MPIVKFGTLADFEQDMYGLKNQTGLRVKPKSISLTEDEELEESDKKIKSSNSRVITK